MWLLRGIPGGDVGAQLAGSVVGVLVGRAVLGPVLAAPPVDYAALPPAPGCRRRGVRGRGRIARPHDGRRGRVPCQALLGAMEPAAVVVSVAVLILLGGLTSGGSVR